MGEMAKSPPGKPDMSPLPASLQNESRLLQQAWGHYGHEHLDTYLVKDVEDPRINLQSIMTRALLVDALFPGQFDPLINEEFRFSVCMNWLLGRLKNGIERPRLYEQIEAGAGDVPAYVKDAYAYLQREDCAIEDYITLALFEPLLDCDSHLPSSACDTFERIWSCELDRRSTQRVSVLEPGCGSANDYRFLDSYGIARFLDYTGFDICEKNIANALMHCAGVDFRVWNVLEIPAEDDSYDFSFVHDLFEHLSEEAFERAASEILRVTRREAWLSFFNLAAIPEHEIKQAGSYHWNTLSLDKTAAMLRRHADDVEVVDIPGLVNQKFGCTDHHNENARTLIVTLS